MNARRRGRPPSTCSTTSTPAHPAAARAARPGAGRAGGGDRLADAADDAAGAPLMTAHDQLTMAQALNRALRDAMTADDRGARLRRGRRPARRRLPRHRRAGPRLRRATAASTPRWPSRASSASPSAWRWTASARWSRCSSTRSPTPRSSRSPRHVAKMRNRTRGAVALPLVIRIPYAGGIGGVEHHCDSSEAYYAHTPGLRSSRPATVEDAYSLLREAIADPDPVVFLEPKRLYWCKDEVDLPVGAAPFGRAVVRREGTRRHADRLRARRAGRPRGGRGGRRGGPQPRGRRPAHDRAVRRRDGRGVGAATGRCVVVQEAAGFAGVGAEIAARVQERCFHSPGRAGAAGRPASTSPTRRRNSSTSTCPASTGSSTPSTTCSGTTTLEPMARRGPVFLLPDLGEGLTEAEIVRLAGRRG